MAKHRLDAAERRKVAQDDAEVRKLLKQLARLPVPATPIAHDDVPTMVQRVEVETAEFGQSYEEANWAKLSPKFRQSHNRLRIQRGMSPIPDPKVDLWVPPRVKTEKFNPNDKEALAAARQFLRGGQMMASGSEGFEDRGVNAAQWLDP